MADITEIKVTETETGELTSYTIKDGNAVHVDDNPVIIGDITAEIESGSNSIYIGNNSDTGLCGNSISIGYDSAIYAEYNDELIAIGNGITIVGGDTYGGSNIAIGSSATIYGGVNIAIGENAVAGSDEDIAYCCAIGSQSEALAFRSTAIGYGAICSDEDAIQLGSDELSSLNCAIGITITSDIRDKTDITELGEGAVEFLDRIKAIRYVSNNRSSYIDKDNLTDEDKEKLMKFGLCAYDSEAHLAGAKKGERIRVGVSAQEVQQALEDIYADSSYANLVNDNLYDFDADEIPKDVENRLSVNYSGFIPFLIKAIQELNERLATAEEALAELQS